MQRLVKLTFFGTGLALFSLFLLGECSSQPAQHTAKAQADPPLDREVNRDTYVHDAVTHMASCHNRKPCLLEQTAFLNVTMEAFTGNTSAMMATAAMLSDKKSKGLLASPAWACIWLMVARAYPDHEITVDTIRAVRTPACELILADDGLITLALARASTYRDLIVEHPLAGVTDLSEADAQELIASHGAPN